MRKCAIYYKQLLVKKENCTYFKIDLYKQRDYEKKINL